ncbi:restriction endonuclease subunit S [Luteimonas sp. JM171]|uniref:restriction endonuclease subunit S n=1 Tax=Luteimonas sp. JM171 TaxID=1896164 RepID=UPI001914D8E8|nr:restriction endonuclease subunit S [Luteimonas sp. JM171]
MKADCYVAEGVAVIRGSNLGKGRLLSGDFVFITDEKAAELGNANLKPGDLVFPHRGAIGEVGIVPADGHRYALSTSLMKISLDESRVVPDFLYYFFTSASGRAELLRNASQVGTPGIATPLKSLRECVVPAPPLRHQRSVVQTLRCLDDRIDNLRQTNATLEAIAQALFKSWFVDFDPVRAKADGREPEGMDAATAALFPSEFEDSELGSIPKGWPVGGSDGLLEIVGGGTPKTSVGEYWGGDIPWFSVVDAPANGQVFTLDTAKKITELGLANCSARLLPPMTTIISARGTVGKVAMAGVPMAMNQSCYALRPRVEGGEAFIYFSTLRFVEQLQQIAHGAVFDTITRESFKRIITFLPPEQTIAVFGLMATPLFERIRANGLQTASLAALRDTLLPRLISGRIRIHEAEKAIEKLPT